LSAADATLLFSTRGPHVYGGVPKCIAYQTST